MQGLPSGSPIFTMQDVLCTSSTMELAEDKQETVNTVNCISLNSKTKQKQPPHHCYFQFCAVNEKCLGAFCFGFTSTTQKERVRIMEKLGQIEYF